MQLFRQVEHRSRSHRGGDRCVQMGQVTVSRQLGALAVGVGIKTVALQLLGDRFHHQFVLTPILLGAQQQLSVIPLPGGACQGITAQPSTPQAQQPFRDASKKASPVQRCHRKRQLSAC